MVSDNEIQQGQVVTVNSAMGAIQRVVVEDRGDVVLICREDEWKEAREQGRDFVAVGFRRTDILVLED